MTEQQQRLLRLLELKWPQQQRHCAGCGKKGGNWEVVETVQWMPFTGRNEIVVGGPCVPIVAVCCADCGWIMLWSAIRLGLLEGSRPVERGEVVVDRTTTLTDLQRRLLNTPTDTKN